MGNKLDLVGNIYGQLKVKQEGVGHIISSGRKQRRYICECSCGKELLVRVDSIRSGNTKSCGCTKNEIISLLKTKHGYSCSGSIHPLYKLWKDIKKRCYNKKYKRFKDYGGRGIAVCKEWLNDPESFIKWSLSHGWEKGLQIDRRENDLGYSPGNCRFVTQSVNTINTRKRVTNTSGYVGVHFSKFHNKWSARLGYQGNRMNIGYFESIEKAVEARNRVIRLFGLPHKIQIFKEDIYMISAEVTCLCGVIIEIDDDTWCDSWADVTDPEGLVAFKCRDCGLEFYLNRFAEMTDPKKCKCNMGITSELRWNFIAAGLPDEPEENHLMQRYLCLDCGKYEWREVNSKVFPNVIRKDGWHED